MPIQSISLKIIAATMLSILTTTALAIQIKCPSADFIKKKFTRKLNRITRVDYNEFVVTYWDTITDEYNQRWSVNVFVNTAEDHDYNDAIKLARDEILHVIDHPADPYLDSEGGHCVYVDKNGNHPQTYAYHWRPGEDSNLRPSP